MNQRQRAIHDRNPLLQCLLAQGVGVIHRELPLGFRPKRTFRNVHWRSAVLFKRGLRTVQAGWQDTGEGSHDPLGSSSPTAGTRRAVAARSEAAAVVGSHQTCVVMEAPLDLHNDAYDGTGTWDLGHAR
jgi:hypothetical protein